MAPERVAVILTGVGKRYDIVSAFAEHAFTIAVDPNPLAPAQYAADVRVEVPRMDDPAYVPALAEVCAEHGVGAVLPLTDLDIEILARAREDDVPSYLVFHNSTLEEIAARRPRSLDELAAVPGVGPAHLSAAHRAARIRA